MSMTSFATVNIPLRCTLPSKQSVSTAGQACGAISSQLNFSKVPIWTTRKSWLKWWVLSYQTMQITHVSSAEKKRDDSDHKPHCTDDEGNVCPFFLSNPEDPVKCIFCDNEVDAHEPVCKGHFIDPPSSETRPNNLCLRCNRKPNSQTNACGCPSGPQVFKFTYTPIKSSWHQLSPPAWSGLFTSQFQGIEAFVIRKVITMMIARSWFPAQMFDSLHIMVQLTGPGGNGKSTLIEFLMSFWDQKDIGVIPNNAQKTFPFEQAINYFMKLAKPCIVFPEIKSNTQIDMADVLRLCEAPDMFVFNRKNQTPLTTACKATIWTASDQFWGTDVGGSALAPHASHPPAESDSQVSGGW